MTHNFTLMDEAKKSLEGKWGNAALTFFIYIIIIGAIGSIPYYFGQVATIFIGGPFALGIIIFSLSISRGLPHRLEQIFEGFQRFGDSLIAQLLMTIFTVLWTMLLIIPGIIAAISYSMTFFIMADDPNIKPMDAIDKSKAMMDGYKWKYFLLNLNFIGWAFACIFTLGIGLFWLMPYVQVAKAKFYDDINPDKVDRDEELINSIGN